MKKIKACNLLGFDECGQCSHGNYSPPGWTFSSVCDYGERRRVDDPTKIPRWCPLLKERRKLLKEKEKK